MTTFNIRIAEEKDLQFILNCCENFFYESPFKEYKSSFDADRVEEVIEIYLKSKKEEKVIFILSLNGKDVGLLAAIASQNLFTNDFVAIEQIWWVEKEARGKDSLSLLVMFELWAKKVGCSSCIVSSLSTEHEELLDKLYQKKGYSKTETMYFKDI